MRWKWWLVGGAAVAGLASGGAIVSRSAPDLLAEAAASERSTCVLRIDGMTCAGCAVAVKMAAAKVDGVTNVEISLEDEQAQVTFDPAKTTPSAIARAVSDGTGFTAEPQLPAHN